MTYNSADHISVLLESLPAAFGGIEHSVIVVDNGSTDDSADIAERHPGVVVVRSTNTGYGAGMNVGARHASDGAHILVLNPDSRLEPGSVPAMMAALRRSRAGIVAPRMTEADGSLSRSLRRTPTLGRAGGLSFTGLSAFAERIEDARVYCDEHEVDWAVGAVMLIDRSCFDALSGFDESYFLYSEETDLCLRARDRGWATVYTPTAEVMHIGGGSGESATTHTMKMVNRVRLYGRRHGRAATWIYYAIAVLTELRRGLLGHSASWVAFRALLDPARRPPQIGASDRRLPA